MALNTTPPIHANSGAAGTNIALEFGWTPPFSLATKTPRSTVPTAGFNLSAFEGKSNATALTLTLTVGHDTDGVSWDIYGFTLGNYHGLQNVPVGSISVSTFRGNSILEIAYTIEGANVTTVYVRLGTAGLGAGYFASIAQSGGNTLLTSAATYSTGTGYSQWAWATASLIPNAADGAGVTITLI